MLERSGRLPVNPEENLVPKALKVAIALPEMSNWVISVNIKQIVLERKKKKKRQFKRLCLPASRDRKPWTKKWNILLVPESASELC